jgi:hypothetical protein
LKDVVFLSDLDDCLFQTMRKCPDDVPVADLIPVGYARDGSPLSFATPRQKAFIDWMAASGELIPVTARSTDALSRAHLPYRRAIAANGGVLIGKDGRQDAEWTRSLKAAAEPFLADLQDMHLKAQALAERETIETRVWIVEEDGIPCYLSIKGEGDYRGPLMRIAYDLSRMMPSGWTCHHNDRNVAISPPHVGKAAAAARLIPTLRAENPNVTIIGVGDSLTDGPFMELCDMAMCPPRSQIGAMMFRKGA